MAALSLACAPPSASSLQSRGKGFAYRLAPALARRPITRCDLSSSSSSQAQEAVTSSPRKSTNQFQKSSASESTDIDKARLRALGVAHIFVMHTSASLTINENASPDVRYDMENALNKIVPEGHHYRHLDEGLDDMPAHVKSSLMGCSLSVPVTDGRFNLGIWQGIWLNEHRDYGGPRRLCITLHGQC